MRLVPENPRASELQVVLGYPTLSFGNGDTYETGEMFGEEAEILDELKLVVADVIAGRVEIGLYKEKVAFGLLGSVGINYATVGNPNDPSYASTRGPADSKIAPFSKNFEPY